MTTDYDFIRKKIVTNELKELKGHDLPCGWTIKWSYFKDGFGTDHNVYYVIPEGGYKWEATFETYGEAMAYIAKETAQ